MVTSPRTPRRNEHWKQSGGFTIIELLIVIGIIAVLVSILLPTLAGIRNRARAVTCMSNERNLYTSVVAFTGDHDGFFPIPAQVADMVSSSTGKYRAFAMDNSSANAGGIVDFTVGTLWPYVSASTEDRQRVVFCPADSGEPSSHGNTKVYVRNFSYSFNQYVLGDPADYSNYPAPVAVARVRLIDVKRPSRKILIYEENAPNDERCVASGSLTNASDDWPSGRHGNGSIRSGSSAGPQSSVWLAQGLGNYCFFDGHVEQLSPQAILNDVTKPQSMYYPLTK